MTSTRYTSWSPCDIGLFHLCNFSVCASSWVEHCHQVRWQHDHQLEAVFVLARWSWSLISWPWNANMAESLRVLSLHHCFMFVLVPTLPLLVLLLWKTIIWLTAWLYCDVVKQIWEMFEKMRTALLDGCRTVTTHTANFCYSYNLCIEDVRVIVLVQYRQNLLVSV